MRASEQDRPELAKARAEWKDGRQPIMREQQSRLVFIDGEPLSAPLVQAPMASGTNTKMTRLRGRSAKGERLNGKAPFGHWGTQTFVAGLKYDSLIAPWVVDAAMNRIIFDTYAETQLAPALKPGDVVILDNLSSHKSQRAESLIRGRGAWLLFLPPPAFAGAGFTAQTSIPSRWLSRSSKPISEKPPPGPSTISGKPLAAFAHSSHPKNVRITSPPQDMDSIDRPLL